ncbi:hypothetical protein F4775DRAFT_526532 [Biscogniauxia sp. FL1348]|nr:hypothetical protein F4775DRAFT_526532 [Biscogniauxia sp. FL1348]
MDHINFHCTIKEPQKEDIDFPVNEESDLTLKEFKAWVQNRYHLEGYVSMMHKGRRLTDLMATLEDTIRPNESVVISTDNRVAMATGGIGMGANAISNNGGLATATGGFGTGGNLKVGGALKAGRGIGGDGKGTSGAGGDAYGGTASSSAGGPVSSGRATGGTFIDRRAKQTANNS